MAQSGIYRIQIGENFYFGSAINLKNREWRHRGELRQGKHRNRWMQSAWDKHGVMHFEVIEFCERDRLIEREQIQISQWFDHPRCMNLCPTAGSVLGIRFSDEARRNMSLAHIGKQRGINHPQFGKKKSPETIEKLRRHGKPFSEERRRNHKAALNHPGVKLRMRMAKIGIKQTAEHIDKRSSKTRGANNWRARAVRLLLPDGTESVHDTVLMAAASLGVRHTALVRWINGTRPWPGEGAYLRNGVNHLKGLKGEYLQ